MKSLLPLLLLFSFIRLQADEWTFLNPQTNADLVSIKMADALNGFAAGNESGHAVLLRTFDAGENWELTTIENFSLKCMAVIDNNRILLGGEDMQCGCATVFYSEDQGYSWVNNSPVQIQAFGSVNFLSADETGKAAAVADNNGVLISENGFISRTVLQAPVPFVTEAHATENEFVLILGSFQEAGFSEIWKSTSNAWEQITQQPAEYAISGFDYCNGNIITAINAGSFPHFNHYVLRSSDWGINWDTLYFSADHEDLLQKIKFKNINKGYTYTETGAVVSTQDAGETWQMLQTEIPLKEITSVDMITPVYGFASSNAGIIMRFGSPAGIIEINREAKMTVYPNPASDFIQIESNQSSSTECSIVDLNGRIVRSFILPGAGHNYKINVAELSPGYYVLRSGNGMIYKLIKI